MHSSHTLHSIFSALTLPSRMYCSPPGTAAKPPSHILIERNFTRPSLTDQLGELPKERSHVNDIGLEDGDVHIAKVERPARPSEV